MSHEEFHKPFEVIRSEDIDRHFQLIEQAVHPDGIAIRTALSGTLTFLDFTQAVQEQLSSLLSPITTTNKFDGTTTPATDGITTTFPLSAVPDSGSESVYKNGLLQDNPGDYALSGSDIVFVSAPLTGDLITVLFNSASSVSPLGSFILSHKNIREIRATAQGIFVYGVNKGSSIVEVLKFDPITLNQIGSIEIDVDDNATENSLMVFAQGFLWVAGSAATTGTNNITKIDPVTMTATIINISGDPGVTIPSLATDGVFIYAFMKGGTFVNPNSVAKYHISTNTVTGVIIVNPPASGFVDMAISSTGHLFVAMTTPNEVRKYDVLSGSLLETFVFVDPPIKIIQRSNIIHVVHGTKISNISAIDVVTELFDLGSTISDIVSNDTDLWISSGASLHKVDLSGVALTTLVPISGLTIQDIAVGFGLIWISYSDDTNVSANISKVFPGSPGA